MTYSINEDRRTLTLHADLDATLLPTPGQPLATAQNSAPQDAGSKKPEGGETFLYFRKGSLIWRFPQQGWGYVRITSSQSWNDSDFDSLEEFELNCKGCREITAEEGEAVMNDIPTPRTDAITDDLYEKGMQASAIRMLKHARQLEKQLHVTRAALSSITHDMGASYLINKVALETLEKTKP